MTRGLAMCLAVAFVIGGGAAVLLLLPGVGKEREIAHRSSAGPRWSETAWPFAMDEWGRGVAFRCAAAECGVEVSLYLRAKLGFCNCTTGVADDEELDRLSDFVFLGPAPAPRGAGHPITVGSMNGRARAFTLALAGRQPSAAISAAFNDRCDAIVATVVVGSERPETVEAPVLDFLNGPTVMQWAQRTLGL
jgi:hypothetical protein